MCIKRRFWVNRFLPASGFLLRSRQPEQRVTPAKAMIQGTAPRSEKTEDRHAGRCFSKPAGPGAQQATDARPDRRAAKLIPPSGRHLSQGRCRRDGSEGAPEVPTPIRRSDRDTGGSRPDLSDHIRCEGCRPRDGSSCRRGPSGSSPPPETVLFWIMRERRFSMPQGRPRDKAPWLLRHDGSGQ